MSPAVYLLIGLAAGAALGFLVGWLYRRGQVVAPDDRLANELRQQLTQRETDLAKLREQLTTATSGQAASDASRAAAEKLIKDQREIYEKSLRDAKEAQEKALVDLRAAFKALSVDTLRELQPQFIERVTETVAKLQETGKGDLTRREEAIKTLVKPLEEQLKIYQQRLQQTESAQSTTLGEVKKHLETLAQQSQSLSNETLQLRRVLSSNQARGRWGEETLRRVVEAAGMSTHCDFSEQTQQGDSKPDLIVHLPGDR
jgi:DNA recombination protein RmuC